MDREREIEAPNAKMKLGMGVDLVSEQLRKRAIGSDEPDPFALITGGGTITDTKVCNSQREFEELLDISAGISVSIGLGVGSGHGRVHFAKRRAMTSTSFCLVVKAIILNPYTWIRDPALTDKPIIRMIT
jgi:hypothetical protein